MKKNYLLISFMLLTIISKAAIHNIYISCTGIVPATMSAACGDTIKWVWGGCSDSCTSTSIPSCATAWNFQINASSSTNQTVLSCAGTYNYRDLSHTGVINVSCTATEITQVNDQTAENIIYPNPSNGVFNMIMNEYGNSKIKELQVYNVLGEHIYPSGNFQINASSDLIQIDLADQPEGIYFINICSENGVKTKKLIIKK